MKKGLESMKSKTTHYLAEQTVKTPTRQSHTHTYQQTCAQTHARKEATKMVLYMLEWLSENDIA